MKHSIRHAFGAMIMRNWVQHHVKLHTLVRDVSCTYTYMFKLTDNILLQFVFAIVYEWMDELMDEKQDLQMLIGIRAIFNEQGYCIVNYVV